MANPKTPKLLKIQLSSIKDKMHVIINRRLIAIEVNNIYQPTCNYVGTI